MFVNRKYLYKLRFPILKDVSGEDVGDIVSIRNATSPDQSTVTNDYQRDAFGHGWADNDKDCQDTRAEILIAHNVGPPQMSSNQCRVVSGQWVSLFTGNKLYKASDVDIDHVLSLKRAWELGASNWSEDKLEQFSNDPANLLVVEARLNRQKGARDITQWLPPANQCQYILRNISVAIGFNNEQKPKQKLSLVRRLP